VADGKRLEQDRLGGRGLTVGAQVALAWLHRQAVVQNLTVVPIPGARKPARLAENLAALEITLTND
jgi:aryl-alcohol dehydrogenase-like predicted oxidoreductase